MFKHLLFQACPDFKGIKTLTSDSYDDLFGFKLALISKGLRPWTWCSSAMSNCFKLALISKGLRRVPRMVYRLKLFQACPDFKGIKTLFSYKILLMLRFQACPDFKGIKTRIAGRIAGRIVFQACPDFKGIKTAAKACANAFSTVSSLP